MLPDDRATAVAVRGVLLFFHSHAQEELGLERVTRATSLDDERVLPVLTALAAGTVIHCDGDTHGSTCRYQPDRVTSIEVDRYLRVAGGSSVKQQSGIGRYRDRFGRA
jgi:hypothetical protein